jgi:hypothetical protein
MHELGTRAHAIEPVRGTAPKSLELVRGGSGARKGAIAERARNRRVKQDQLLARIPIVLKRARRVRRGAERAIALLSASSGAAKGPAVQVRRAITGETLERQITLRLTLPNKSLNRVNHLQYFDGQFMDAVRSTLLGLPSRLERLIFIASLQNPESRGQFSHLLAPDYDREEIDRGLIREHLNTFQDWLGLSLEDKLRDLEAYASGRSEAVSDVAYYWLLPDRRVGLVPRGALPPESQMFDSDVEMLLMILDRRK